MHRIFISLRGDGRPLTITQQNARLLYFIFVRNNKLSPADYHLLELPEYKQRPCGGVLDHLYRRCELHPDLCKEELLCLERSLNRLLSSQRYSLLPNEGAVEHGIVPTAKVGQHKGVIYLLRCGLLFVLRPFVKEKLALLEPSAVVLQDNSMRHLLMRFEGVQSRPKEGQIQMRFCNYFDLKEDRSMFLSSFTKEIQRIFLIERILPMVGNFSGLGWARYHQGIYKTFLVSWRG